jgi:flagellar biosynthesis/type III secretory pathway M-ring protein FliF/YscJ
MRVAGFTFFGSIATLLFGQTPEASLPTLNSAYQLKDLGVAGILALAVFFLYREILRERREKDALQAETKSFVKEQTEAVRAAAHSQSTALQQMAKALGTLEEANRQQITVYREHINTILKDATARRD